MGVTPCLGHTPSLRLSLPEGGRPRSSSGTFGPEARQGHPSSGEKAWAEPRLQAAFPAPDASTPPAPLGRKAGVAASQPSVGRALGTCGKGIKCHSIPARAQVCTPPVAPGEAWAGRGRSLARLWPGQLSEAGLVLVLGGHSIRIRREGEVGEGWSGWQGAVAGPLRGGGFAVC